jgi:hypothetical protein
VVFNSGFDQKRTHAEPQLHFLALGLVTAAGAGTRRCTSSLTSVTCPVERSK